MLKRFIQRTAYLTKETVTRFFKADPVLYSAAIAFFTVFSLPPVLVLIANALGWVIGKRTVEMELFRLIRNFVGSESAVQAIYIIDNFNSSKETWWVDLITIFFMLFSASIIFSFFKKALNSMWSVKPKPKVQSTKFAFDRLISFSMVILLGFILVVSLVADVFLRYLDSTIPTMSIYEYTFMDAANVGVSFLLGIITFGPMFKILPDAKVRWREVWVGAFITAALFTLGKYLIGFILHSMQISDIYGAAGSFVLIMLWVFYSTFIILLGGEFTLVYSEYIGHSIEPTSHAVRIETKEVEISDGQTVENCK